MKMELELWWLRVVVELFPVRTEIRRYRVGDSLLDGPTRRNLHRQIARRLRNAPEGIDK